MEEYGLMEYLELTVIRCGRWSGNREFIWSGLSDNNYATIDVFYVTIGNNDVTIEDKQVTLPMRRLMITK